MKGFLNIYDQCKRKRKYGRCHKKHSNAVAFVGEPVYSTRDCADRDASSLINRIACIEIEFTEGDGFEPSATQ